MTTEALPVLTPDVRRAALAFPVFHKIWIASAAVVLTASALTGLAMVNRALPSALGTAGAALVAVAGALIIQHVLLRLALQPIELLADAAERIAAGDDSARATESPLADSRIRRVIAVFNQALDHAANERERLRALAVRAREVHEADRVRTAQELHERTAQALAAMLLRLQIARRDPDAQRREVALDALRAEIVAAGAAVQRIAFGLRPPAISELGAGVAIETYARQLRSTGIEVTCRLPPLAGELSPAASTALYRVVQEAVDNAVRHSGGRTITIEGGLRGEWVEAAIADDGIGFPVAEVIDGARCLGIFEMEQRAEGVGGQVRVESSPGQGTRVSVRIPRCTARIRG